MAKCVHCNQRKAKRHCPALGASICSLCCGMHRQKEINCPSSCTFLVKHTPYQEKRTLEKKLSTAPSPPLPEEDILSDERLAWLAFNIEVPIARMLEKDASMMDGDVLTALDYARDKLVKESSLIIMSEKRIEPKNELGEAIYQSVEQCRFEKKIIVPGELQTYTQDEKKKCLDRVILAVQQLSKGNLRGRGFLEQLIARFSKISELSRHQKLHIPD